MPPCGVAAAAVVAAWLAEEAARPGMVVTLGAEPTSGQRSTCARDLRLRSRCQETKAAVIPLASRAT
jgi:hypothetical protein